MGPDSCTDRDVDPEMRRVREFSLVQFKTGLKPRPLKHISLPGYETFIETGMCRGVQHACIAHQCHKAIVTENTLEMTIEETEICLRSGSVRHADAR